MSELPEKQAKRLHALIQEAETNLAAAKELLISIIGDDGAVITPKSSPNEEVGGKIIEGVFDGEQMVGPDGHRGSSAIGRMLRRNAHGAGLASRPPLIWP